MQTREPEDWLTESTLLDAALGRVRVGEKRKRETEGTRLSKLPVCTLTVHHPFPYNPNLEL